jgi:predicted transcriptional regulator
MTLYIAGETIQAGDSVALSIIDGKLYTSGPVAGEYIGEAAEQLREGFRVALRDDCYLYEDDA